MFYHLLLGSTIGITVVSVCFAIPLYVFVLVAIVRNHRNAPFNSEFFTLFVALGIVDISCYLLFLVKKLIFWGFCPSLFLPFDEPNRLAAIWYTPYWVFAFLQYQFTFLLTLNRFLSVVFPGVYNAFWTTQRTRQLIGGSVLVSFTLALPVPFSNCTITEYEAVLDGNVYTFHYGPVTIDPNVAFYLKSVWTAHVCFVLVSSLFFYSWMIKRMRKTEFIQNKKKRNVEREMFFVGGTVVVLNALFATYLLLRDTVLSSPKSHIHEWILYFISDIYDLPNGLIIWLTSSNIRRITVHGCIRANAQAISSIGSNPLNALSSRLRVKIAPGRRSAFNSGAVNAPPAPLFTVVNPNNPPT